MLDWSTFSRDASGWQMKGRYNEKGLCIVDMCEMVQLCEYVRIDVYNRIGLQTVHTMGTRRAKRDEGATGLVLRHKAIMAIVRLRHCGWPATDRGPSHVCGSSAIVRRHYPLHCFMTIIIDIPPASPSASGST